MRDTFTTISGTKLTGISSAEENVISIYPNPTNGLLNIEGADKVSSIILFNDLGQQVLAKNNSAGDKMLTIDLSNLPSGIYLVHLRDAEFNVVIKRRVVKP